MEIISQDGMKVFQALRYEEDRKTWVVKGPITTPRNFQEEETFTAATEEFEIMSGAPVVCHWLEDYLNTLNGEIGDLGSWDEEIDCYEVHFEDKGLELCSVKRVNIRILFELPDE